MSIKKIAEKAGVSTATVSRVLNNPNYKCSSEALRGRIWQIARELNYMPNEAARNLKMGVSDENSKIYYIDILMTRTESAQADPFFSELLRIIEGEIQSDGLIVIGKCNDEVLKKLTARYKSLVSVNHQDEEGKKYRKGNRRSRFEMRHYYMDTFAGNLAVWFFVLQ